MFAIQGLITNYSLKSAGFKIKVRLLSGYILVDALEIRLLIIPNFMIETRPLFSLNVKVIQNCRTKISKGLSNP